MLVNALRGHLAELGIITRQSATGLSMLVALVEDEGHDLIPPLARSALFLLVQQLPEVHEKARRSVSWTDIHIWHCSHELSRRLETIPGIGPITASAIVATVTDASLFKSGRQLAAWLGLVPRQNSSEKRIGSGGSASKAIPTSVAFLLWEPMPCFASVVRAKRHPLPGLPSFWRKSRTTSLRWPWQTRCPDRLGADDYGQALRGFTGVVT
ncbi:hypothetical protein X770_30780 [Mesorhizobium sp. LSJC269B00]|nr:hypothetical protein X770_30780 [Mesorhizobium sp. LSJC269B00]